MTKDQVLARHILECIDAVQAYVEPGQEVLWRDRKTWKATIRELQDLSESTQKLSTDLKARHAQVPWALISDFRNVIVHNYLGLDLHLIWKVITEDLELLRAMAESESSESTR